MNGTTSSLFDLFSPPSPTSSNNNGTSTASRNLYSGRDEQNEPLLAQRNDTQTNNDYEISQQDDPLRKEDVTLLFGAASIRSPKRSDTKRSNGEYQSFSAIKNDYDSADSTSDIEVTPKQSRRKLSAYTSNIPSSSMTPLASIFEVPLKYHTTLSSNEDNKNDNKMSNNSHNRESSTQTESFYQRSLRFKNYCKLQCMEIFDPSTFVGAFMFLLFHNVYCLTMGAAIIRPHALQSMVGPMTEMAALGIIMGSPIFWWKLRNDIPALYPSADLFAAPFLANIAAFVDEELYKDPNVTDDDNDAYFLTTFAFLASISLLISGILLILASIFKLANLGSYLPFPVLCGFFASVGVLTWTLAFKVDNNGQPVHEVIMSNDWHLIKKSLIHHIPTIIIGAILKKMGPKHPFLVAGIIFSTIAVFYMIMFVFNISMAEMVKDGWFWSSDDLKYRASNVKISRGWSTPSPCGWIFGFIRGDVHWKAVSKGIGTSVALGVLYLIRCSLHAAALKKNVSNLVRQERIVQVLVDDPEDGPPENLLNVTRNGGISNHHRRKFSEALDFEASLSTFQPEPDKIKSQKITTQIVAAKPTNASLKDILYPYGLNQCFGALIGSFGVVPSVSSTTTMYLLRAENLPPQICSCLMLFCFYYTDFSLVGYIPKAAFSSMLVLAFLDLIDNWAIKSYYKTKEKTEWLVVPLIVVLAFTVGLLQSVFLGLAMSTFLFVGSFFKSGVVKYVSNGIKIRSTIERPTKVTKWLDNNADQIQILVLQNYLFFGNASSILSYITSMFDDAPPDVDPEFIPPIPKIIIIDLTLVTGMDTSAVDVFTDILNRCKTNSCKLFLSGVSNTLRQVMALCGIKHDFKCGRAERFLRFFNELDAAIGKAEDCLIDYDEIDETPKFDGSGFEYALQVIDDEHGTNIKNDLLNLEPYTEVLEVEADEVLYRDRHMDRGLFFIEYGTIKIERNSDFTFGRSTPANGFRFSHHGTLNAASFRTETFGRELAKLKAVGSQLQNQTFNSRLARVGPGWILGLVEVLSGSMNTGKTIAVTKSRLHYISYRTLSELEIKEPILILKLYKLLSLLMAKRQEMTIAQLGTLQNIMSSPAQKHPTSRKESFSSDRKSFHCT